MNEKIIYLLEKILEELLDRRDEGKAIYVRGTLSTTSFTVIDLITGRTENGDIGGSPNHPVKSFSVRNRGTTNILFAHNITNQAQLNLEIIDSTKENNIFSILEPGEVENIQYNINCIRNVHLIAVSGTPTYKIKFSW